MTSYEMGGYELGDRRYYLGDKNMAESFYNASTKADPFGVTNNFNQTVGSKKSNNLAATLPNKRNAQTFDSDNIAQSLPPIDDYEEPRELQDYGRDFYNALRKYHEERTGFEQCSWKDVLETWKILKRSQEMSKSHAHKSKNNFRWDNPYEHKPHPDKRMTVETQVRLYGKSFYNKGSHGQTPDDIRNDFVKGKYYEDVRYTLQKHHNEFEIDRDRDRKMENGFVRKIREKEAEKEKMRKERIKKRLRKRWKKKQEPRTAEEMRVHQQKKQLKEAEEMYVRLVTQTVEDYHINNPDNLDFIYPDKLFLHWNHIKKDTKVALNIDVDQGVARETFNNFFNSRLEYVYLQFKKRKGCDTNSPKALARFYNTEVAEKEKRKMNFKFYCPKNVVNLFKTWCKQKEEEKRERMKQYKEQIAKERREGKKQKGKKRYRSTKVMTTEQKIEELSKPKDRLKIGKTLLKMKNKFPKDRILREMIVDEFKSEKIAKRPLEYDNYDSDEEIYMKHKNLLSEKIKEDFIEGEAASKREMRLREEELLNRFSNMLKKYKIEKKDQVKKRKDYVKKYRKEDKAINDFLLKKAKEYRKMTLSKMDKKIDSETQFLSDTYHALKALQPDGTKRVFPHYNAGESKELKKKSFPLNFKHEFFRVYRTLEKKKLRPATKNKVGFWAPAGQKRKKSHNKKIIKNSLETKHKEIWDQRGKIGVWEEDDFKDERKKILMKLSDAEHCTFQPIVRSRLPKKMKISETEGAYDQPEDPMKVLEKKNNNLVSLKLKKRGFFQKALFEYVNGKGPIVAYTILCENFNIEQIREELGNPKKSPPPKKGTKLYYLLYPQAKEEERKKKEEEKKKKEAENKKKEADGKDDNPMKGLLAGFKKKKKPEMGKKKLSKKEMEKQQNNFQKALLRVVRPTIQEDTKDPVFKNFLYDVLDLILMIESHQVEVEKVKKLSKKILKKEKDKPIKEFMCPLMEKCPDFESDRWPISNTRGTRPLGKRCTFAHHPNELYFKGQKKNKEKYLKQLEEKMEDRLQKGDLTTDNKVFVQSGAIITNMHGLMKTRNHEALIPYNAPNKPQAGQKKKEDMKYGEKLKISKKVQKKQEMMRKNDDNMRRKLGFLRRAEVLYDQERYKEAFKTIVKAIRIVIKENDYIERVEEKRKDYLRDKLDLHMGTNNNTNPTFRFQREQRTDFEITAEGQCPNQAK